MDFFQHQDEAKKRTTQLVVLFALAVIALIALLNLLIAAFFIGGGQGGTKNILNHLSIEQWLVVSAVVLVGIGGASLFRWLQLRGGGKVVARSLGGRLIHPDSTDFYEQRLLNVVEEIALAAGVPVPPVYLLEENGINAFAAGYNLSDAVIGVTRGCMQKLSREQLQGVIAHEFSHIFNGDMRLNIRIMALLFGILFITLIGRLFIDASVMRSHRVRSKNDNRLAGLLFGVALIVVGYCGVFFGNLIKAAVSRQREFLADASAVQYTRNPEGIAGALKVIAMEGSQVKSSASNEAAHLFFGAALGNRLFSLFATHPDIDERIRRVQPNWDGQYCLPQTLAQAQQESADIEARTQSASAAQPNPQQRPTAAAVEQALQQPNQAPNLLFALLLAQQASAGPSDATSPIKHLLTEVKKLPEESRLSLVERSIPTLKQMSKQEYQTFRQQLEQLVQAQATPNMFAWCLYRLTTQYLDGHFQPVSATKVTYRKERQVLNAIGVVLSALAHYGNDDETQAEQAFLAGCEAAQFNGLKRRQLAGPAQLDTALAQLQKAYPHIKGRLLKAMHAVIEQDGQIRPIERDLIITIAAILEVPAPLAAEEQA